MQLNYASSQIGGNAVPKWRALLGGSSGVHEFDFGTELKTDRRSCCEPVFRLIIPLFDTQHLSFRIRAWLYFQTIVIFDLLRSNPALTKSGRAFSRLH
jgi:hypothetical protein